ncbi:hypothetical protein FH972_006288 [Carpinus fangiana]|uniref:Uncharacterized protein n=1 Tax=Carpinus fangiana TaxID=176857 RepID=A0A5N6QRT6_9ROSI|nr:hypothetical protein FH972_006288 [Carpinus fangiana]
MGWNRSWLVESKEFKFALKDSSPVLTIQERRKGVQRAVNLRKKEQVWLVRIFGELVAVEDSRVFRDQTVPGFPRVLAQKCGNRNGRFLVIEEYNGRGKCGSIFVPEGRNRQGWNQFVEELRNVLQCSTHKWEIPKDKRRYSEVLCATMKEGQEKSLEVPANLKAIPANPQGRAMAVLAKCQGNDLIVKGDLFSSDSTKCLSVAKGKERSWERTFPAVRQCGQEVVGPRMLEITKETQVFSVDLDKGSNEIPWSIKEKKKRNGKGLLPRPNSSWVAGRTGFGLVGSKKAPVSSGHEGGLIGLSASLGQTSRNLEAHAQPVFFTGKPTTPDVVAPAESSRKIEQDGRTQLGQFSRTSTAPTQPVLSPTGMCTTLIVEAPVEALVAVELSATATLDPLVPEFHALPVFSPTGLHAVMDIKALAEFPTVSAQPVPTEYARNKESTTSVTDELSATEIGVFPIVSAQPVPAEHARNKESTTSVTDELSETELGVTAQGTELRDTLVFKEVYRRRDGSTITPVKGTDFSLLKEGSVRCMEESATEGSEAGDLLDESSSCHPDSRGVSEGLPMTNGEVNDVLESSPVMKELPLVKEVGRFAGLSCDGHEGLQDECFKRILAEKHGKGGDSIHSTVQQ